jgi:hypothetical protein
LPGNTTVLTKVATTLAENGHKRETQGGTAVYNKRRRNKGRPRKRRQDQIHPEGYGTDMTSNPSEFMLMFLLLLLLLLLMMMMMMIMTTRNLCSEVT